MKNYSLQKHLIRLGAALALAVSAVHAQAQNVLVTFDLTQLQNNATSSTITGSDGITTLTVSTIDNWGGNTGAIFVDGTNGLMTGLDSTTSGLLGLSFNRDVNFESFNINTAIPDFGNNNAHFFVQDWDLQQTTQLMLYRNIVTGSNDFSAGIKAFDVTANSAWAFRSVVFNTNGVPVYWNSLSVLTTVPEPASYALLLGFGAFLFIMIRHRIRR